MKIEINLTHEDMHDVIKALKKQEETKPYKQVHMDGMVWYHCPFCGTRLMDQQRFCMDCGQKIGWRVSDGE